MLRFAKFANSFALVLPSALLASCGGQSSAPQLPTAVSGTSPARVAHYYLVPLRGLGGNFSIGDGINDRGWITGDSNPPGNKVAHAVLWVNGKPIDLGTLGGPNSSVNWPLKSDTGLIAGGSEISQSDPYLENFCGIPSAYNPTHLCLGFRWRANTMTPLPTLGGNNSFATEVNDLGQVVGFAEKAVHDPSCLAPQVLDYHAVVWKRNGKKVTLPPIAGDTISEAVAINKAGDAGGASGPCASPLSGPEAAHAVLWKNGSAIDLGNLGGTAPNIATAINDRGQVAGISGLPGNTTVHAFLWRHGAMRDLGTLPGDALSLAFTINNRGQVVGQSCDASGNCRAFIWQNGSMTDLNLLMPKGRLYLYVGSDINDSGQIVGGALNTKTGHNAAFVAIPSGAVGPVYGTPPRVILPERLRMHFAHHRFRPIL